MNRYNERDFDYIAAILDHCDRISSLVLRFGDNFENFLTDDAYSDSVLMNIFQIGEAASKLSDECKERLADIPWHKIVGTRNVIAHGYIKINYEIIWEIANSDIPALKSRLEKESC